MNWTIWGRWPSDHDLDLRLNTSPEEEARLHAQHLADEWYLTDDEDSDEVRLSAIALTPGMWEWAINTANGLPLDITLWEEKSGKFLVLYSEAPYVTGTLRPGWAMFVEELRERE
jgi:hypothetical protein